MNVSQLLIGSSIRFSQSEVVLHSNFQILEIKIKIFLRMVGEYGHRFD